MKTVIYVDVLLILNYVIALFLLQAAGALCGMVCGALAVSLASGAAAVSALIILLPALPFLAQLFLKAAAAAVCCGICFHGQGLRRLALACGWYLALNLLLAGAVSALVLHWGTAAVETNNLAVYCDLSPLLLLACVGGMAAFLRLLLWLWERPNLVADTEVRFLIPGQGGGVALRGFFDSGLLLRDLFSEVPVLLVHYRALPDGPLRCFLERYFSANALEPPPAAWRLRFLPCRTAAGERMLPAVPVEEVRFSAEGKRRFCARAVAAFCPQPFWGGHDLAFGQSLLLAATGVDEGGEAHCKQSCPST